MPSCVVALGGNVGDVRSTFHSALRDLETRGTGVLALSRCYRTVPIGDSAGSEYWNAACLVQTALAPESLLQQLHEVEARHGRARAVVWGPRTLDLDLILYGDETIETPQLTVPHPACWYRRFVLDPMVDIVPDRKHPRFQQSILELRTRLMRRPLPIALTGPDAGALSRKLQQRWGTHVQVATAGNTPTITFYRHAGVAEPPQAADPATVILTGPTLADDLATAGFVLAAALDEPRPVD